MRQALHGAMNTVWEMVGLKPGEAADREKFQAAIQSLTPVQRENIRAEFRT